MANNENKAVDAENTAPEVVTGEVNNSEFVSLEAQAKGAKAVAKEKSEAAETVNTTSKKSKKVTKNKKKFGQKLKEIFSELKKVSWPKFGKVVKQTGIVIAVVLFFLVIIGVADFVLSLLFNLIV